MRLNNGEVLFAWPLSKHTITAGWTYNDGSAHNAIDLRASVGTPVYAAEDGQVTWVQDWDGSSKSGNQSYGNAVKIKHADYDGQSLETLYAHLSKRFVSNGDSVKEGQMIGYSGETGNCYGAHLHFEVRWAGSRTNPLNWLDANYSCASSIVAQHLGTFHSVQRDNSAETPPQLQLLTIGPVSNGDAMAFWDLAKKLEVAYKSEYVEV